MLVMEGQLKSYNAEVNEKNKHKVQVLISKAKDLQYNLRLAINKKIEKVHGMSQFYVIGNKVYFLFWDSDKIKEFDFRGRWSE